MTKSPCDDVKSEHVAVTPMNDSLWMQTHTLQLSVVAADSPDVVSSPKVDWPLSAGGAGETAAVLRSPTSAHHVQ